MQAGQHLANRHACFVHIGGLGHLRAEFVVNRLPIESRGILLPMRVADGGPDSFEGIERELALGRIRLRAERQRYSQCGAERTPGSHASTLAQWGSRSFLGGCLRAFRKARFSPLK